MSNQFRSPQLHAFYLFFSEDVMFIISLHLSSSGKFLEVLADNGEGRIQTNTRIKDSKIVESIWNTQTGSWEEFNEGVGRIKITH